jgi:hypothetical protein
LSVRVPESARIYTYANDAVRANQLDKRVSDGALGIALAVSLDVSEITNVTGLVRRSTMGLVVRVDYVSSLLAYIIIKLVRKSSGGILRLSDLDNLMRRPDHHAGTDSQ